MEISLLWCHILWAKLFIASSFTLIVCLRLQSVIRLTIGSLALFQIHNNIPNIISTTASKATTTTITATTARTRTTARTTTTIHYRFPNTVLRHIRLENNDNKPVTNSRDTQEVPAEKGRQVLKIIANYKHQTSIFDDFGHYERRQQEEEDQKTRAAQAASVSHFFCMFIV